MNNDKILKLKNELEEQLIKSIQKVSTSMQIHHILKKADEECIVLNDEIINTKGFRGLTAFTHSIWSRDEFSINHLIDNYPNLTFDLKDTSYETNALFLALRHDYIKIAEILIEKGFDINQRLHNGNTIFMQLCNPKPYMSLSEDTLIYVLEKMNPNLLMENKKGQNALDIMESKAPREIHLIKLLKEKTLEQKEVQRIKDEQMKLNQTIRPNIKQEKSNLKI